METIHLNQSISYLSQEQNLQNIELNALPVFDDRYIKTKQEHMMINFIVILVVGICQKMV